MFEKIPKFEKKIPVQHVSYVLKTTDCTPRVICDIVRVIFPLQVGFISQFCIVNRVTMSKDKKTNWAPDTCQFLPNSQVADGQGVK